MIDSGMLPAGWSLVPLGELLTAIDSGKSFKCEERPPEAHEVGVIKVSAVSWGEYQESESKTCVDAERIEPDYFVRPGDFLFSRANTIELVGACVIARRVSKRLMLSDKILRLHFAVEDLKPWVLQYLRSKAGRDQIEMLASGNQESMRNIGQERLRQILIPLPPCNERESIRFKVDELLSELAAATSELIAARRKLALYRQSLLKCAVEGVLTSDWRSQRLSDEASPIVIQPDSPGPLPDRWTWSTVGATGFVQLGRQRAPQFHVGDNMVPYLRVANVFEERIDTLDVMSMHFSSVEETKFQLHRGDILLNEGQSLELIGRPAMFRGELQRVCFTNSLVRYKAGKDINPEFALLVFLHYMHSGRFQKIATITTNIAHLSAGRFSGLEFPVPPLDEQGEIVSKFDQHRDAIAQQQLAITRALTLAAAQRQNILRAAFSGQLVPQDPSDEPASALLERIHAQRQAAAPAAKRKPGRPAKVTP